MPKRSNDPFVILSGKKDKLDRGKFNLLENLLVFCALKERSVPKENGIHFRVSINAEDVAVCILFQIDRRNDPLIKENEARPDYMVLYADRSGCICTIIEMKSARDPIYGISQIKSLRDKLRREIIDHLPAKFRNIKFQGILLASFNSQMPNPLIEKEASSGFVIHPLQYDKKAELFRYISKLHKRPQVYVHEELRHDDSLRFVEQVLIERAMPDRIRDAFCSVKFSPKRGRQGVYINYALSKTGEYAALATDSSTAIIAIRENKNSFIKDIREELEKLEAGKLFKFELISEK